MDGTQCVRSPFLVVLFVQLLSACANVSMCAFVQMNGQRSSDMANCFSLPVYFRLTHPVTLSQLIVENGRNQSHF